MKIMFNRLLEQDENYTIQVYLWDTLLLKEQGKDTSGRELNLIERGVYCMYTVKYVNYVTGEKYSWEEDARPKIDLGRLVKKIEIALGEMGS